jgi:predicted ATPase
MKEAVTLPVACPAVVGRADQIESLQQFVQRARREEGRVVLISGEAGIGKSRLVAEAKERAPDFLLLQGSCFPADFACPYAPLLDLLRSLVASNPPAAHQMTIDSLALEIFPLLPELVPEQMARPPILEPEQEKRRLFAVLARFFLHLSAQTPVLMVVEDVHWSDDTSLDFLLYLARRVRAHRFLLLVTYRRDELRPALSNWLAQLARERLAQEVGLSPLVRADIDAMLSAIFEEQHTAFAMRRFLHGELADALYALTEGNPFFVEEILGSLLAAGDIFYIQGYWNRRPEDEISLPPSIQAAVQQRMIHVGEEAEQVLTLAAVAGRHFDFALLQQLTGYAEDQLLLLMKQLVAAQLVVEESEDQFAFRHALTRQAIYSRLLTRERRMLHRTIAETLEQRLAHTPDLYLEDLASHFYQARVWPKVGDCARRAGEKALKLYSHRVAANYFTWALQAIEHLALPPAPLLYRARGLACEALGEFEKAQQDYTQALGAARATGDRVAEWQSLIDLGFLWAERDYIQAEIWLRQALALAQELDRPLLQARSLNRIGNWYLNGEQTQESLRYHREALALFEQLHDTRGIAETLDLLGMVSYLGGDLEQGTVYYRQAVVLFRELDDRSGLTSSLATLALRGPTYQTDALISVASLAEASEDAEQALSVAREIGHRAAEAYALFQLGLCLGSRGEYGRALAAGRQSLEIASEIEHRQWQAAAHNVLGGIYSSLLAYQQAREHFEQAMVFARETGSLFWARMTAGYLASVLFLVQDIPAGEKVLDAVLSPDTPAETMTQRMLWCAATELELLRGQPARAFEILARFADPAIAGDQKSQSLRVLKLRGETLFALQRLDEAEVAWKAAQELASAQGVRPVQWRLSLALGKLYLAQRRGNEAEQSFTAARAGT